MISVIKIGGNVIDNPKALDAFLKDFARIPGKKVLVHGGGKEATRLSEVLGIKTTMIAGRRVTDRATLDIVTMVYAGLINKRIASMLQAYGCNAVGLSGADGNVIRATRRSPEPIDYGFVGDINPTDIDDAFISILIESGHVPVFCAITHDGDGNLLNCNADSIASSVAIACSRIEPTTLTFCFEKEGVMLDVNNDSSVIRHITPDFFKDLIEKGIISDGMLPKISNAFKAIEAGVESVSIKSSTKVAEDVGTRITQ